MPLKLRVISDQYKQLGKASSRSFGSEGGRIGRAPDNDWILPDPDRYVSSHHAKITFRGGAWVLEDLSTNGIFVNDADLPLSVTGPHKIKDGDRLRLGDYDIIASIDEADADATTASGRHAAPTARGAPPAGKRTAAQELDYLRRHTYAGHSQSRTRQHMGDDLGEDLDITGLFVAGSRDESDAVEAFDLHGQEQLENTARTKKLNAPQPAAKPAAPVSLLDDILLGAAEPATPQQAEEEWHMATRRLDRRKGAVAGAAAAAQPAAKAQPQPPPKPIVREAPKAAPRVEPPRPAVEADRGRRAADAGDGASGIEAFCRGAGIEPSAIPANAQAVMLGMAGQMLREVVLDLMEALRTREEQSNRLTTGQSERPPAQTNPLKVSTSVEEALRKLLAGTSSRHLGGADALRDAFNVLNNHELAIGAAVDAALNDLLSRVDPNELQERFDRGLKRNALMGVVNKSKYWELYTEFYPLLNQRDAHGWPAVFTQEFSRAYSETLADLEKKRK